MMKNKTEVVFGFLYLLYLFHITTCEDQSRDFNSDQQSLEKRGFDRYRFQSALGKRQNEQLIPEDQFDEDDKRGLDYNMFRGTLGKRETIKNIDDLLMSKENIPVDSDYGRLFDEEKRGLDRYGFSARLGKRQDDFENNHKRQLDRYSFMSSLGKRGLDMNMFRGSLGKRIPLDSRMFMSQLGKRKLDYRMFSGQLGKRGKLDNRMFYGHLGKRAYGNDLSKRARFPYYIYRSNGRPIYTQTRGMDRLSFSARLGKRSASLGSSENYPVIYETL